MQIARHRVVGAPFEEANATGGEIKPALLVVHDTAGSLTKGNVVSYFAGNSCSVSAHVVVERDGSLTQMVPFNVQANHAGTSTWNGRKNCNKFAIGIEIMNPGMMERRGEKVLLIYRDNRKERIVGTYSLAECEEVNTPEHGHGWCLPYTPKQIETVKELCKTICAEYEIKDIVGHYHISPKRKVDVTPLFPMEEVRAYAAGAEEEPAPAVRPDVDAPEATISSLNRTSRKVKTANAGEASVLGGGLTLAVLLTYVEQAAQFVKTYGIELAAVGGFVVIVYFSAIKHFTKQDHVEGRYKPSGENK